MSWNAWEVAGLEGAKEGTKLHVVMEQNVSNERVRHCLFPGSGTQSELREIEPGEGISEMPFPEGENG